MQEVTVAMGELPVMVIGESFIGEGADAAHINTVLGRKEGPVGTAWASALATPSQGHTPFVAVIRPGLPAKPFTLFINKAPIASPGHGDLTWGAAQAGVAAGVADAVADGVIDRADCSDLVLIAAVWVNPAAADAEAVYRNNRAATLAALQAGLRSEPHLDDVLAARDRPANPYYTAPAEPDAAPADAAPVAAGGPAPSGPAPVSPAG
jgi:5,6,7,8-tetrahydromethanopterin hydro-lyase